MKKDILVWAIPIFTLVLMLFIINGMFPLTAVDVNCYREIAETECPNQDIYLSNNAPFGKITFTCYQNASQKSRKRIDNINNYDSYIFFEEDHKKCSNKYYWFGLKKED